jgi:gliding motility-associated-like protein
MSFDNAIQLHADPIQSYETGKWSITEGSGVFDDDEATEPWVTGALLGTNTYKWTVENGDCVEEDLVTYMISDPVIPELISPNSDTFNDDLTISGINFDTQKVELTILNGAGSLVFSTSNANGNADWKNWDGTNSKGEDLSEGTYYYLLKVSSGKVEGLVSRKSGFIILKRK